MHPAKPHLLLVDGDAKNLRVMEVTLRTAGYQVVTAVNGLDAWEKCETSIPDLVISDTRLDEMDGFELCRRVKADERFADTLFVFLSSQKTIDHKVRGLELGVDDYLTKPIYIQELVTRVKILLQKRDKERLERRDQKSGLSGSLSDMGVVDLVQTLEIGRKTGEIRLRNHKDATAAIFFREGKVVDVVVGSLVGEAAFFRLLPWTEGSFEIEFKPVDLPNRIDFSTQGLLMEGMRRMDERARLADQLPSFDTVLSVDPLLLAERLSSIPDEANPVLRLFDGKRDLGAVLDESPLDDQESLTITLELYRSGLLRTGDKVQNGRGFDRDFGARAAAARSPTQDDQVASWFVEPTGVTELKKPGAQEAPQAAAAPAPTQPQVQAQAPAGSASPPAAAAAAVAASAGGSQPSAPTTAAAPPSPYVVGSALHPGGRPALTTAARRIEEPRSSGGLWLILLLLLLLAGGGYYLSLQLGPGAAPSVDAVP